MTRKQDIKVLITSNEQFLEEIESLVNQSLEDKEIDAGLRVKIKNLLENAKSILDYLAHDIAEQYGLQASKIYFPIVGKDKDVTSYKGAIGRNLPGLEKQKLIFDYIESIQPYNSNYSWLGDFSELSADTKHQQLIPIKRQESKRIISEHQSGSQVSWNPDSVKFGDGVFIHGAKVNPITQLPTLLANTVVRREIWVNFQFANGLSVLPLLKHVVNDIPNITSNVYKKLEEK